MLINKGFKGFLSSEFKVLRAEKGHYVKFFEIWIKKYA